MCDDVMDFVGVQSTSNASIVLTWLFGRAAVASPGEIERLSRWFCLQSFLESNSGGCDNRHHGVRALSHVTPMCARFIGARYM